MASGNSAQLGGGLSYILGAVYPRNRDGRPSRIENGGNRLRLVGRNITVATEAVTRDDAGQKQRK